VAAPTPTARGLADGGRPDADRLKRAEGARLDRDRLELVVLTAGFFAAHSVASGWVGARARVAPALYLCLYYIGCSAAGSAGGVVWADGGWAAVALFATTLLVIALAGVTMSR
jgi:hypothetical protein